MVRILCLIESLGLENFASLDEIKKAFRTLSLQHHPDKSTDPCSPQLFLDITEAYKFLLQNKSLYDNLLRQHDLTYFKERLILVNQESHEEFDVELASSGISFECRQCRGRVLAEQGSLAECLSCSLIYLIQDIE